MAQIDKYVHMLESPKASVKFEACEELRVANESSEAAVLALEKVARDPDPTVADAARRALDADVHVEILTRLGRSSPKSEEQARRVHV